MTQPPVIEPGYTFASVTEKISAIVLRRRTPRGWIIGFGLSFVLFMALVVTIENVDPVVTAEVGAARVGNALADLPGRR